MPPPAVRSVAPPGRLPRPTCGESFLPSARRYLVCGGPDSGTHDSRRTASCGYRSPNSTVHDTFRRGVPDSIDTTSAARRVTRLGPPVDLCPQIAPPASKAYRLPVSLRHVTGFPGLGLLRRLRPHRLPSPTAAVSPYPFTGGRWRVPMFRFPTCGPCRWHALPLVALDDGNGELPSSAASDAATSRKHKVRPVRTTSPQSIPLRGLSG